MITKHALGAAILWASLLHQATWASDPLDHWQWRNPLPTGNSLYGIIFVNDGFVAVGEAGSVLISPDGVGWNTRNTPLKERLRAVTYGNGRYVVVGDDGAIAASTDLLEWIRADSGIGPETNLTAVAFGNGIFVAVGQSGVILRSTDGVNWVRQNSGVASFIGLNGVAYGDGLFAVASDGGVLTSPDGIDWTAPVIASPSRSFFGIIYAEQRFLAIGIQCCTGGASYMMSTNGVDWMDFRPSFFVPDWIMYGNDTFVVSIGEGSALLFSEDGLTWTDPPLTGYAKRGVVAGAYGNGTFVVLSPGTILTSQNGINWKNQSSGNRGVLTDVARGNGQYVALGGYYDSPTTTPTAALLTSTDGLSFIANPTTDPLSELILDGDTFVAIGHEGVILRSANTTNWTRRGSGTFNGLNGLAHGDGTFVAVGDFGTVVTSPDGLVWTVRFSGTSYHLYGVVYGNNLFVAVGYFGAILTSPDAINWTVQNTDVFDSLRSVTFGNDLFVAVGQNGAILTSADAAAWTRQNSGTDLPLNAVEYGNGIYVTVGGDQSSGSVDNVVLTSADGANWTARQVGASGGLLGAAYIDGSFWLLGVRGTILQSGDTTSVSLAACQDAVNGNLELTSAGGELGRVYRLQNCPDLRVAHWADVLTFTNTQRLRFLHTNTPSLSQCFYRLVSP